MAKLGVSHMVETIVLVAFATMLLTGIAIGIPLWMPLLAGLALFFGYGLHDGATPRRLVSLMGEGMRSLAPILALFAIIGALTAVWRAAGTLPLVMAWSAASVRPGTLVLATFLGCVVVSFVTGSSFSAAATIGVAFMAIGRAMGADAALMGGAILSGSVFGDRCSPLSSSAMLVCELTGSDPSENLRRTALFSCVPLLVACGVYATLGLGAGAGAVVPDLASALRQGFVLSPVVAVPLVVLLALSLARVRVHLVMLASLASALGIAILVQGADPAMLVRAMLVGYASPDAAIGPVVDGGGMASMLEVGVVVLIVSAYSELFRGTGLLRGLRDVVTRVAERTTPFLGVLLTAAVTEAVTCEQFVGIMLCSEICSGCERSGKALALDIENSAVVLPVLLPWSTDSIALTAFVGAPLSSAAFAVYPVAVIGLGICLSLWQRSHPGFVASHAARPFGLEACDNAWAERQAEGRLA